MILITGASGFVGQHLLTLYSEQPYADSSQAEGGILSAWRSNAIDGGIQLDLTDAAAVQRVFDSHPITAVIHLAAEARTALCERDPALAQRGNVEATRNLLSACAGPLPYFLYASTDMVFRGDAAPYSEDDPTDAVAAYGKSKADTEKLVRGYKGAWAIVRPALIYGPPAGGRVSSLTATLNMLRSGDGQFFTDEFRTPVYVKDLVQLMAKLTAQRLTGTFNAGGPERVSRYKYARRVAIEWGMDSDQVQCGEIGNDPVHAWRPKDISLVSDRAHELVEFTPMDQALKESKES